MSISNLLWYSMEQPLFLSLYVETTISHELPQVVLICPMEVFQPVVRKGRSTVNLIKLIIIYYLGIF